jgi:CheY-like chemotaxis protein
VLRFLFPLRAALRRRKRAHSVQEQLIRISRANHELSESLRAKDELLATLAHELRNPLSALETASRLLRSDKADSVTIKLASDVVGRQVGQMSRLLEDLLDVTRLRLNRLELRKHSHLLATIVRSALEATQPLMDAKGHTLSVDMPDRNIRIIADGSRVSQVISNLLANAAKYTEPKGQIALRVRLEGPEVVIEVRDNGIGIPPESLNAVFGMFAQLRSALPRSKGGLGIGLALVRGIVELHGGTVHAFSEGENCGSKFTVRLPLGKDSATSPTGACSAPTIQPTFHNILLADDNPDALEVLAALLRIEGHTVYLARDGLEAIKIASERCLDVVILDLGMPKITGYEVARRLRSEGLIAPEAKLIALTGWGRPADKSLALKAGFDHHLTKPVDVEELQGLLQPGATLQATIEMGN